MEHKITTNLWRWLFCLALTLGLMMVVAAPAMAAYTSVTTQDELQYQINLGTPTIKLENNIKLTSRIYINSGKNVTLDLHGFTLSRNLSKPTSEGNVIIVNDGGQLTLQDRANSKKGNISGGQVIGNGGGVYVKNGGTVFLEGGSIESNTATQQGGGVYVEKGGTFKMASTGLGGSINNNSADKGGGVYVAEGGTFSMSPGTINSNSANIGGGVYVESGGSFEMNFNDNPGTIQNNTANEKGGGIYADADITMDGSLVISDNFIGDSTDHSASNVYLNNTKIDVKSDLAPTNAIGVTLASGKGVFTNSANYTNDSDAKDVFTSDSPDYVIYAKDRQAALGNAQYQVVLKGGEHAVTYDKTTQNVTRGGNMEEVTYTANRDYRFTFNKDITQYGITVKQTGPATVTVTGIPIGDEPTINITVPNAKKFRSITPGITTFTYGDTGKSMGATTEGDGTISYAVKTGGDVIDVNPSGELTIHKVGNATVTASVPETDGYCAATKDINVTIKKADPSVIAPTATTPTYNGQEQPLVNAGTADGGTMQYALGTETEVTGEFSNAIPNGKDAGTYYVWYKVIGDDNHNSIEPVKVDASIQQAPLTVKAKDKTITYGDAPAGDGVTYDGFVNNEDESALSGTLAYTYNYQQYGNVGEYTITPSGQTSNNYNIQYQNGKLTVEQLQADVWVDPNPLTYNGKPQVPEARVTNAVNGDQIGVKVEPVGDRQPIDVGDNYGATLSLTGEKKDNYYLYASTGYSIVPAPSSVKTAPRAIENLTENGQEQALVTVGTAEGGTMQYAVTDNDAEPVESAFKAEIPTGKDAGTYYVWYRVKGDKNHNDSAKAYVTVTIAARKTVSYTVTFKVVNGAWNDGKTGDQIVTLSGYEGEELNLKAEDIPAVGNKPNNDYKKGYWDVTPNTDANITKDTTYTYAYAHKDSVSRIVTFKVVNGAWDDTVKDDKVVTLTGNEGDTLKLAANQIPAVGNMPDEGYKAGSWDSVPSTETVFTGDTTYTYTYEQKQPISATVTFKVANGAWNDGTTEEKTVTLSGLEGDTLKLSANQIPAVGNMPNEGYKAGSWDLTPSAETVISEDTTYTYTYAQKQPISATVTFKVANGQWNDGTTEEKTVTLSGLEGDTLKLTADQIPEVGSKPQSDEYKEGYWDVVPDTDANITKDVTYTYSYAHKDSITRTVTFKVVNGAWDDTTKTDEIITLIGNAGDQLKLAENQIPAVGNMPDKGYKAGSWDVTPSTETAITGDTTYTYTYEQKQPISATVIFKVANGQWNDGETADKTVTLSGYEGDTLKLSANQIPAVGNMPNEGYKAGSWDVAPSAETAITGDTTYTYTYEQKQPISATVTFKVANGAWNDGTTEEKTVTLTGLEGDTLKLKADQIPEVGSKPQSDEYKAGYWDVVPDTDANITKDVTYTYSYAHKDSITRTVTFKVVNGAWDDTTKTDEIINLVGNAGDQLKLAENQIPAVGNMPDKGYKAGSWDVTPNTETVISEDTTYTYTYEKDEDTSLEKAKAAAKSDLDTLKADKKENDYDLEDWQTINKAVDDGKTNIDAATTVDAVTKAKDDAVNAVNAVKTKADKVIEKINALPASGDVKATDKDAIEAARKAYDALTDEQKTKVPKETVKKLIDDEEALRKGEDTSLEKAKAAAKSELDTLKAGKNENDYDPEDWQTVTKAVDDGKTAIDNAATVDDVTKAKNDAVNAVNAVKTKADKVIEKINALPASGDVKTTDKDAVKAARKAYDALTDEQKAKVPTETLKKLVDDEQALLDGSQPTVYFRSHIQNLAWDRQLTKLEVGKSGSVGTTGRSLRLEALDVMVPEGFSVTGFAHLQNWGDTGVTKINNPDFDVPKGYTVYRFGTTGQSRRMEALSMGIVNAKGEYVKGLRYTTHLQNYSWQGYVRNGSFAGTRGMSLRLEAIRFAYGEE